MNNIPQELDWVTARAACTIGKVFNQICDEIGNDVAKVNSVNQLSGNSQFRADMHSDGSTIFVGQPNLIPRARVIVGVSDKRIVVTEEWSTKTWDATIGLNDEGRCILKLEDGTELEKWQFRKKALEGLFFGSRTLVFQKSEGQQ
jgi:hypothetical protein